MISQAGNKRKYYRKLDSKYNGIMKVLTVIKFLLLHNFLINQVSDVSLVRNENT